MLYLTFDRPVDDKALFDVMTKSNLAKITNEPIDNESEHQIFQFKTDNTKKILFYLDINANDHSCENINIALSYNNDLALLKELFIFLGKLGKDNLILIDQEIKNELYLKDIISGGKIVTTQWTDEQHRRAIISPSFADFYKNSFKLVNRDKLLGK